METAGAAVTVCRSVGNSEPTERQSDRLDTGGHFGPGGYDGYYATTFLPWEVVEPV